MIELSKEQISVLGRPNFACARIAQVLIRTGVYAPVRANAEYEQAVFIHWASRLVEQHGEKWVEVADALLCDYERKFHAKLSEMKKLMPLMGSTIHVKNE
jgi:hypothetical protein